MLVKPKSAFFKHTHAADSCRNIVTINLGFESYPDEYSDDVKEDHRDHEQGRGNGDVASMIGAGDGLGLRLTNVRYLSG